MKRGGDFSRTRGDLRGEQTYDLEKDFGLIEASFAAQYGIRLRREKDISVAEFMVLLAGLLPGTPLGVVAGIRGERDMKVVARFSREERRIYDEWRGFLRGKKVMVEDAGGSVEGLQGVLGRLFG